MGDLEKTLHDDTYLWGFLSGLEISQANFHLIFIMKTLHKYNEFTFQIRKLQKSVISYTYAQRRLNILETSTSKRLRG